MLCCNYRQCREFALCREYGHTIRASSYFSPSDFSFPHDAILAEATPNSEMTLIADVNLDLLKQVRTRGGTRNLVNRRPDLYRLEWVWCHIIEILTIVSKSNNLAVVDSNAPYFTQIRDFHNA